MDTSPIAQNNPEFNRAQRTLNRWVGEKFLSSDAKEWLVAALDPFHDTVQKHLEGWPDVETGSSLTRRIPAKFQISKPAGLPPGNWELVIVSWPFLDSTTYRQIVLRSGNTGTGLVPGVYPIGGIQAFAMPSGHLFNPINDPLVISVALSEIGDAFTTGVGRLVALGFETHNTTSDLNRQGSVTVAKMMQGRRDASCFQYSDPTTGEVAIMATSFIRLPPNNQADLMRLNGSKTWKAADGAYSVCSFHSIENPPFEYDYNIALLGRVDENDDVNNTSVLYMPDTVPGVAGFLTFEPMHLHPIHTSIQWYDGLSESTTIVLNTLAYYESFPNQSDVSSVVLTTPSCEFDPTALAVYSHAISAMPVGVPVKENNLGDWFANIVETISNVASWVPHPLFQAGSKLGNTVAPMMRSGAVTQGIQARPKKQKVLLIQPNQVNSQPFGTGPPPPLPPNRPVYAVAQPQRQVRKKRKVVGKRK
jgi:hypothetical protein